MKFSKILFLVAGVYGLIVTLPLYILETRTGIDNPPPVNHPEYYYAFAGVTAAWQVLFLVISRNPAKYRAIMPVCTLEKAAMLVTWLILQADGRFPASWVPFFIIDCILGILFLTSFFMLRRPAGRE